MACVQVDPQLTQVGGERLGSPPRPRGHGRGGGEAGENYSTTALLGANGGDGYLSDITGANVRYGAGGGSGMEYGFLGSFGVDGLSVGISRAEITPAVDNGNDNQLVKILKNLKLKIDYYPIGDVGLPKSFNFGVKKSKTEICQNQVSMMPKRSKCVRGEKFMHNPG